MTKEEIISLIRVDRNGEPWYTIKEVKDAMQQFADQECAAKDKRIKELEERLRQIACPLKYLQEEAGKGDEF